MASCQFSQLGLGVVMKLSDVVSAPAEEGQMTREEAEQFIDLFFPRPAADP